MVLGYKTDEDTGKDGPHPVPVEEIPVVREIKVDEEVATSQLDCVASVKVVKVDLPEVDLVGVSLGKVWCADGYDNKGVG